MSLGNFLGSVGGAVGGLFGDAIGGTITGAAIGSGLGSIGSDLGTGMGLIGSGKGLYDSFNNTSLKNQMKYDQFKSELDYQYWSRKMSNRHTLEVGDLRQAGLNPILSANSAGSVASAIPNGAIPETSSQQSVAGAAREANRINAMVGESTSAKNVADAQAQIMNAETQRMQTLGNLSLQKTQAVVNNALKGWYVTQASNLSRYPSNNGRIERELRGVGRIIGDSTESLLRSLGVNSAGALDSSYHVHVPGTNRSYSGLGTD